jgi:hypothetical protein
VGGEVGVDGVSGVPPYGGVVELVGEGGVEGLVCVEVFVEDAVEGGVDECGGVVV